MYIYIYVASLLNTEGGELKKKEKELILLAIILRII